MEENGNERREKELIRFRWISPNEGEIKLNFDGWLKVEDAGCGFILRSNCGAILAASYPAVL